MEQVEVKVAPGLTLRVAPTDIYPAPPTRPPLAELVNHRITETAGRYATSYPAAMKCLLADHEGLTAYLRFPGHLRRSLLDPPRRLRPRTAAGSQDGGTGQNVSVIA